MGHTVIGDSAKEAPSFVIIKHLVWTFLIPLLHDLNKPVIHFEDKILDNVVVNWANLPSDSLDSDSV